MFNTITTVKGTIKGRTLLLGRGALALLIALFVSGFVGVGTGVASSSAQLRPATVSHQYSDAAPAVTSFSQATLGWTGRNAAHNLNLMGYDPVTHVFGTAYTLTDTTLASVGPSLDTYYNNLYVAWLGIDHHLNVGRYNLADPSHLADKVTLNETSPNAPSLSDFGGRLYLGWRGTNGQLNIISSMDGSTFNTKVSYNIAIRTSPTLVSAGFYLFVGWEDISANSSIVIGQYNPSQPTNLIVVVTNTTSQFPVGLVFEGNAGYPALTVAWRTTSDAHIHLGLFEGSPTLAFPKSTAETTPYGPALAIADGGGPFMSWTGTDVAHSINVSPVSI